VNNPEVLAALKGIVDPEIGVNIVDLGLVYRAEHSTRGIEVKLTLSTPSCPLSEMMLEEVREALKANFADAPGITVELVWDPPWTPDRMSEAARMLLG
jgi:metal-sulfur cluster biosynthetic enzyme